jgi:hypothetical protein
MLCLFVEMLLNKDEASSFMHIEYTRSFFRVIYKELLLLVSGNPCPMERHNRGKSHTCYIDDFLFRDHVTVCNDQQ